MHSPPTSHNTLYLPTFPLATLTLLLTLASPTTLSAQPSDNPCQHPLVQSTLELVNRARSQHARQPVSCDPKLVKAARIHSDDQCRMGVLSHVGSDGNKFPHRYRELDISYSTAGENVARGATSARKVHQQWMNSPGHRRNILDPEFTRMGLGHNACNQNHYWTQTFAGPPLDGSARSPTTQSDNSPASAPTQSSSSSSYTTPRSPLGTRLLGELAGSLIGAGVGMGFGALAGIEYARNNPGADRSAWIRFSAGAGALVGGPFGAFAAGDLLRGRGKPMPTFLGGLGGTIAGLSLAGTQDSVGGQLALLGGGNVLGAIIGYEISHLINHSGSRLSASLPRVGSTVTLHHRSQTPLLTLFGSF